VPGIPRHACVDPTQDFWSEPPKGTVETAPARENILERRWSSRRFPYGYLVTTSPQSLTRPWSAAPRCQVRAPA